MIWLSVYALLCLLTIVACAAWSGWEPKTPLHLRLFAIVVGMVIAPALWVLLGAAVWAKWEGKR